jgi:hypothetical protein
MLIKEPEIRLVYRSSSAGWGSLPHTSGAQIDARMMDDFPAKIHRATNSLAGPMPPPKIRRERS